MRTEQFPKHLLWLALAVTPLPAQSPDDRFATVKAWSGTLDVRATASGTVAVPNTGSVRYTIDRHLSFPFTLSGPGFPVGWLTCSTAASHGTIDDVYVTHFDRTGCENTLRHFASGPLESPPPDPNGTPEWPCTVNGFQFQILPIPFAGTYTSWGFYDTIAGEQLESQQCPPLELSHETTFNFMPGTNSPVCGGIGCIDLPAEGFRIEKRWAFDAPHSTQAGVVDVHYDVHLDLVGCGEELEVVVSIADYESWRPEGGKSEDEEGNQLVVQARVQGKNGCPTGIKASRFVFELMDVSIEPGVCMNYPPSESTSGKPDLAFLRQFNQPPWRPFASPSNVIITENGAYTESPRAYVSSFDWGGRAVLKVTAEFDELAIPPIVGHLEGDGAMTAIRIPRRAAGSNIADVWKSDQGVEGLPDQDDEESLPAGDGHTGDGLHLFEEYRGFYQGEDNDHISGNPKRKDLFVASKVDATAGIALFQKVTGLEVHGKMLESQLGPGRVVNFQRNGDTGNDTDQHGLVIVEAPQDSAILGLAAGGPALPAYVERVLINSVITPRTVNAVVGGDTTRITQRAFVVAHELLHACNVFHHGDLDNRADIVVRSINGALAYVLGIDGVTPLLKEGACGEVAPVIPPGAGAHLRNVFIAFKGGQHSGEQSCLVRYNLAKYYASADLDRIRRHDSNEPPGFALCSSTGGTGVNAAGRCPESRYGNATVGCCARQICVNDRRDHTPRSAPASPCGSGAGGEAAGREAGGAAGVEESSLPIVSVALDEQRRTTAYRGWPLLVTLQVIPPGFGGEPAEDDFVVAAAAGGWTGAIQLRLKRDGVEVALWPLSALAPAAGAPARLALERHETGLAAWWISPSDSAQIDAGEYTLDAVLDTTGSSEGWKGIAIADPVRISVTPEPAALDAGLEARKALALARWHAGQGELAAALEAVAALLSRQPSNVRALGVRAEILDLSGDAGAALAAHETAVDAFYQANPHPEEPPAALLAGLDELQARLLLDGPPAAPVFRRGDANADGVVNISDPIATLGFLFLGSPGELDCLKSADADDTGSVNLTDAVYLLVYLFSGGAGPPPPGAAGCGQDATADELACTSQPACGG